MNLDNVERLFKNFDLNKRILELTDKVISKFMEDSQVFYRIMIEMKVCGKTHALFEEGFKQIIEFKISLFEDELKSV